MQKSLPASLALAMMAMLPSQARAQNASGVQPNSCLSVFGTLGSAPQKAFEVDGKTLKEASDVKSLRSKSKDSKPIIIRGGDFSNQKFGNDNFSNVCFVGTKLTGTRWVKSRAPGIGFINVDLTGSTFDRVILDYALFRNSTLTNVDASGAQLAYGQLDGGWEPAMTNLKLDTARMVGFRFVCGVSSVDGCSFERKQLSLRAANLTGASVSTFSLWDSRLEDVILDNTEISMDQMTQFPLADIRGPVIIKAEKRRIALAAPAFRVAASVLQSNAIAETECNNPEDPLGKLFCLAGQGGLRAYRDDINRLYDSTRATQAPAAAGTVINGTIVVTASTKVHDRYIKALRRCALKEDDEAIACVSTTMAKRRTLLVNELTKTRPLEENARALYVSAKQPMINAIASDRRLAGLSPLMADNASNFLLAYRDEDQSIKAIGYGLSADGKQCATNFAIPMKSSNSRRKKAFAGNSIVTWMSGAEFTMGQVEKVKKRKRKPKKGAAAQEIKPVAAGCAGLIESGPLVRLPISEEDWDKLWASRKV